MRLTFGRACADSAPTDQIGDVLGTDQIEIFCAARHASLRDIQQQTTRRTQTLVDVVGVIQIRIIDQAFPTNGGARLLKVDTHDDEKILLVTLTLCHQARRIVTRSCRVMNRTRPYHHYKPVVLTIQHRANR